MGMVFAYYNGKFEFVGEEGNPVDMGLPESTVFVELPDFPERLGEKGIREHYKVEVSKATDSYIKQKLKEIDEDLADLVSEKSWLEGVFAARGISPEAVRNATVAVVVGQKTIDEAISELSIPDDLVSDFKRAVEIAKIIAWKEAIWKAEEKLENQIDSMTLEELLQLDVRTLCEKAYKQIPLEV